MIEAPSLKSLREHREENRTALCCLLLIPKFSDIGFNNIVKRFEYLNTRTGDSIDFYWAGYGAYWNEDIAPDMENIGIAKYDNGTTIPWAFSQKLFAEFIDEIENETSWKYSGGAEIMLFNSRLDFSNCIILKIDEMLKDKVIDYPHELLEAIIQFSRVPSDTINNFSLKGIGKAAGEELVSGILSFLPKPFENLLNTWKKGKHYAIVNIK